jgi:hypothetical protein
MEEQASQMQMQRVFFRKVFRKLQTVEALKKQSIINRCIFNAPTLILSDHGSTMVPKPYQRADRSIKLLFGVHLQTIKR